MRRHKKNQIKAQQSFDSKNLFAYAKEQENKIVPKELIKDASEDGKFSADFSVAFNEID